jgi:hypothetical protein
MMATTTAPLALRVTTRATTTVPIARIVLLCCVRSSVREGGTDRQSENGRTDEDGLALHPVILA